MKKQKLLNITIVSIIVCVTILLLFSYKLQAMENDNSIVSEETSNNNRIYIMGNDTQLLYEYNMSRLQKEHEQKIEQAYYDRVKTIRIVQLSSSKKSKREVEKTNRWDITLTQDEIDLLAKIVWVESRGESDKGKRMVIEVIFNRMVHDEFKGGLTDVLSAKNQFCSWKLRGNAEPTELEYDAIDKVLKGESEELTLDHVYFSTSPRNNRGVIKEKNHYFCKY